MVVWYLFSLLKRCEESYLGQFDATESRVDATF